MSKRQQKVDGSIPEWALETEGPFTIVHKRLTYEYERHYEDVAPHGVLLIERDSHGDIEWEFTPDGWTTCDGDCSFWPECDTHVRCDDRCLALLHPRTRDELLAALEHWQRHSASGGCSHGC